MTLFLRIFALFQSLGFLFHSRADLLMEIMILRQQVAVLKKEKPRPKLTGFDRLFWLGLRQLWSKWRELLIVVQPETVVNWHRKGFKLYWRIISKRNQKNGKPPSNKEIIKILRRMAVENPTWGAPRIHGELLKLGFKISERTVSRYLAKIRPGRSTPNFNRWESFLENQRKGIAAMDFFVVPTLF